MLGRSPPFFQERGGKTYRFLATSAFRCYKGGIPAQNLHNDLGFSNQITHVPGFCPMVFFGGWKGEPVKIWVWFLREVFFSEQNVKMIEYMYV